MDTPPGGRRGSIAVVFVEFLLLDPPVIVLPFAVDETDPDAETEALPD